MSSERGLRQQKYLKLFLFFFGHTGTIRFSRLINNLKKKWRYHGKSMKVYFSFGNASNMEIVRQVY